MTGAEREDMENIPYRALSGFTLDLANTTRPDIPYAEGILCRYMDKAGSPNWAAACCVLRYLSGTVRCGIRFPNDVLHQRKGLLAAREVMCFGRHHWRQGLWSKVKHARSGLTIRCAWQWLRLKISTNVPST